MSHAARTERDTVLQTYLQRQTGKGGGRDTLSRPSDDLRPDTGCNPGEREAEGGDTKGSSTDILHLELYAINLQFYNCYMFLFDFVDKHDYEAVTKLDGLLEWIDTELEKFNQLHHIPYSKRVCAYKDLKNRLLNIKRKKDSCVRRWRHWFLHSPLSTSRFPISLGP